MIFNSYNYFFNKHIISYLILIGFIVIFSACGNNSKDFTEQQLTIERAKDVWAFRSILDSRIRMLSIGLNDELWVAYSTETGSFYKAWDEGVQLGGSVYGSSGQPTTKGNIFLKEPEGNPWVIIHDEQEITPEINYKGHTIIDDHITLKYELIFDGNSIEIEEQPEYYKLPRERRGLKREFRTSNMPMDIQLGLKVRLSSITSENDIYTDGLFSSIREESEIVLGGEYKIIYGTLFLNNNDETHLSVAITPKPVVAEEDGEEEKTYQEITVGMMESYGCNTCHGLANDALGPAYMSIAERYENTSETQGILEAKVKEGGYGNWGEIAMIPHPNIPENDVTRLVSYILDLDTGDERATVEFMPESEHTFEFQNKSEGSLFDSGENMGVAFNIYQLDFPLYGVPQIRDDMTPQKSGVANILHVYQSDYESHFSEFERNFAIQAKGFLNISEDAEIDLRLASNDGSRIYINGEMAVETVGNWIDVEAEETLFLEAGKHPFVYEFYDRGGEKKFSLQWRLNGENEYSVVPPEVFTYSGSDIKESKPLTEISRPELEPTIGDKSSLVDVHPSFDLSQARPDHFHPKISGMDFMSDGRMVVSTWDSTGSIYMLEGVQGDNPESIQVKRIAAGFAEPLGLKVVDDEVYVLQKQELTKLIDLNNDGVTNEYRNVNNEWTSTDNHHEFAFGLVYKDGYFYGALSVAVEGPGPSAPNQAPHRGKVFKISKEDGTISYIADGLRTPNGIGFGVDNEIFIADNQGDWLPANKIIHLREGAFYGNMAVVDSNESSEVSEMPPVVYLEHDKIGNSPSQPAPLNVGPYQNQMIHGDVTHGGIKRVFAEKVDGEYQGAVFRFSQGLEAGVNRLIWGPDNALYVGGVGNGGNWGQYGKLRYGLQKMTYNGESTFEMLAVRAKSVGIEIEFTEPLRTGVGESINDYTIKQWWYLPTANYGGPNMDEKELDIENIRISPDRKKVTLELSEMKKGHVIYIRLNRDTMISTDGKNLWTTEAWYTMNNIPD